VERAVNEADKHDLVDPETLRRALDAHKGEPGVRKLATLLDRHTFRLSDSDLEVLFRPLARAAAIPPPGSSLSRRLRRLLTKQVKDAGSVACSARERPRTLTCAASGDVLGRFTHWQIAYAPNEVTDVLRRFRLRPQPARVADGIARPDAT